jgi:serine/threonine protein kinase
LIGKGSFGEVYLVQKKTSGKYYAMKILPKSKIIGQNLTKYAYAERNIQSTTIHPFIVRLFCAFQTRERLFLVLDYCPGGDLGREIQKEKRFSEEKARIYLCEVLLAIEELHNREIIYRDLKPDNIVLDADGHALLTDFGLSKEGVKDADYTQSFCGSIAYLAPEMLKKTGHGRSVDWYLLGVLLYEMLIGIPPYFHANK